MTDEQLFLARGRTPPRPYAMAKPRNNLGEGPLGKPLGGLWTSELGGTGSWLGFCVDGYTSALENATPWALRPWDEARVFDVNGPPAAAMLRRAYGFKYDIYGSGLGLRWYYDWEQMRADGWDGIHLSAPWSLRFSDPNDMTWYGWDCICTVWLRWVFLERPRRLAPAELQRLIEAL